MAHLPVPWDLTFTPAEFQKRTGPQPGGVSPVSAGEAAPRQPAARGEPAGSAGVRVCACAAVQLAVHRPLLSPLLAVSACRSQPGLTPVFLQAFFGYLS